MLTSLIEEYRFNKNTLSKYLEITEETIDGVVMGNVECLLDDPALRLKILSKAGFLYFGAIEDKDRQLSGFLEVLVSYHGISKLTIAKMAGVEENDIDRLLASFKMCCVIFVVWYSSSSVGRDSVCMPASCLTASNL